MQRLLLVHDVLDKQLCAPQADKIGRVDAIVLELAPGKPPRVKTILVGGPARQERLGRWAQRLGRALRAVGRSTNTGLSEIPFAAVTRIADTIVVDVNAASLPSEHIERWLCERIVRRIPGAEGERK
ncbi:hypothetical protein BH09GEM1_BH09GEM1_29390 [soil metagenome]